MNRWSSRYAKLRFRRRIKKTKKNVEQAQADAAETLDKHIVRRWKKFNEVKRFIAGWMILVLILTLGVLTQRTSLAQYYQAELPAEGGIYNEGLVSDITNLNPIFASTAADKAAASLIFSGLVRYDDTSTISPDLAKSWTVNEEETIYTFTLRDDIFWHDGIKITADDVVFTFEAIQHPDTRSPLNQSWQDITVQALDEQTVTFTLPNPFPPFIHSVEGVGILPSHLLEELAPNELRAAQNFNLQPVGSGPFRFEELFVEQEEGQINLVRSEEYHLGRPSLERFVIRAFSDHEEMIMAFKDGELAGIAGVRTIDFEQLGPEGNWTVYDMPLFNNTMAFFNNSNEILKDKNVRKALVHATDRDAIFEELRWSAPATEGPLLSGQLGFDPDSMQP
ncbi:MAG: ABC transporter substrate-binding protein, partial [Candidatus Saccharimonadales bacterium]|nr:ABC transporter substrate-binding protein [Candidatus Saccharimonadales bacterium]